MPNRNPPSSGNAGEPPAPRNSSGGLPDLPLGGFLAFTTIDFPGRLAAVLFLQGCPWRCRYCYNPELWPFCGNRSGFSTEELLKFFVSRRGLLDGVVFSGGEAAAFDGIGEWMKRLKAFGYAIGLHTAGIYPEKLRTVLPYCDWVGLDIKAPFQSYESITQIPGSGEAAKKSLFYLLESGVDYEIRTTAHTALHTKEQILELARDLAVLGVRHYRVQRFTAQGCTDEVLCREGIRESWRLHDLLLDVGPMFQTFQLR